jgi:hypothetical protein
MKKIISILLAIGFCLNTMAQSMPVQHPSCDFITKIKFKNGKDTIVIKAVYNDFLKSAAYPVLKALDKEKKLRYSDFGYNKREPLTSSAIAFTPENCTKSYIGTVRKKDLNNKEISMNTMPIGTVLYLTCVFFESKKWEYNGVPFFVIIEVVKEKP